MKEHIVKFVVNEVLVTFVSPISPDDFKPFKYHRSRVGNKNKLFCL